MQGSTGVEPGEAARLWVHGPEYSHGVHPSYDGPSHGAVLRSRVPCKFTVKMQDERNFKFSPELVIVVSSLTFEERGRLQKVIHIVSYIFGLFGSHCADTCWCNCLVNLACGCLSHRERKNLALFILIHSTLKQGHIWKQVTFCTVCNAL